MARLACVHLPSGDAGFGRLLRAQERFPLVDAVPGHSAKDS